MAQISARNEGFLADTSYGRASTRSTAGRDTRAGRRRAAARLRRVSSVSRFARLRISQFQRKHTGRRDGYAWVARRSSQGSLRPHVSRVACRVSHGATSPEHDRQAATAGRDCRDERASSPNAALRVRKAVERAPDCRRQLREVAGEHEPGWPAGVSGRSRVNTGGGRVPVVGTPASGEVAITVAIIRLPQARSARPERRPVDMDRRRGRRTATTDRSGRRPNSRCPRQRPRSRRQAVGRLGELPQVRLHGPPLDSRRCSRPHRLGVFVADFPVCRTTIRKLPPFSSTISHGVRPPFGPRRQGVGDGLDPVDRSRFLQQL